MTNTGPIFFDIWFYNWTKAAFVASLRSIFSSDYVPEQYKFVDDEEETKILIYTAFPYRSFRTPCLVVDIASSDADVSYIGALEQVGKKDIKTIRIVLNKSDSNTDLLLYNKTPIKYNDIENVVISNYDNYTLSQDNNGNAIILWQSPYPNANILLEIFVTFKNSIPHLYFTGILRLSIKIDIYTSTVTDAEKLIDIITTFLRFFLRDKLAELRITYTAIDISGIKTTEWNGELLYTATITIRNCHTEYELIFPESLLGYIEQINLTKIITNILSETETIKKVIK